MVKIESSKKKLDIARKDLENRIRTIGWEAGDSQDDYCLFVQTKGLLKSYLHFKEEGEKYSAQVNNSKKLLEMQELYSFNKDLSEVCKLFEDGSSPIRNISEFIHAGIEYGKAVKEGKSHSDLQGKKGNEANIQQIQEALMNIGKALHPNIVYEVYLLED
jgi:hypothetical protein